MAPELMGLRYSLEHHLSSEGASCMPVSLVPEGMPEFLDSPLAWSGAEQLEEDSYTYRLSKEESDEIKEALTHFKGSFNVS